MSFCARTFALMPRLKKDAHRSYDNSNANANKECVGKTEFENNWGLGVDASVCVRERV